jgi:sulfhydrogenase subunit delta
MKNNKKIKVGIVSLTGCEGCCFAVLDMPHEFLELKSKLEVTNFRLFEEDEHVKEEKFDVVFVEGSPLTSENIKDLKRLRKNSKVMVAFGGCAHMGGIYHIKNYHDKEKLHGYVYNSENTLENLDVKPIGNIVKVDYVVPGCPVNPKEFFNVVYQLLLGKSPEIKQNPVCYECQSNGYECVLQKGEVCLGPITQGGCEAICLKSAQGCWGCRGLLEDAEVSSLVKKLKEKFSDKEITKHFEVFGIKEMINK